MVGQVKKRQLQLLAKKRFHPQKSAPPSHRLPLHNVLGPNCAVLSWHVSTDRALCSSNDAIEFAVVLNDYVVHYETVCDADVAADGGMVPNVGATDGAAFPRNPFSPSGWGPFRAAEVQCKRSIRLHQRVLIVRTQAILPALVDVSH